MKLSFVALSLAASALAQSIHIGVPTDGQTLTRGLPMTMRLDKPQSLTGSTEIGVGIALHACSADPCEDASAQLGVVLYAGAFSPQLPGGEFGPFENFSAVVPAGLPAGLAVLSVVHTSLLGAGPYVFQEIKNVTVTLA